MKIVSCVPYAICPLISWTAIFLGLHSCVFVPFGRSCYVNAWDSISAWPGLGVHTIVRQKWCRWWKRVGGAPHCPSPSSTLPLSSSLPPSLPSEGGPPSHGRSRQAVLLLLSGGGGGGETKERGEVCQVPLRMPLLRVGNTKGAPPPSSYSYSGGRPGCSQSLMAASEERVSPPQPVYTTIPYPGSKGGGGFHVVAERRLTTVICILSTIVVERAFLRDEGLSQATGEYPKATISFPVSFWLSQKCCSFSFFLDHIIPVGLYCNTIHL